jgi:hypothetical protein
MYGGGTAEAANTLSAEAAVSVGRGPLAPARLGHVTSHQSNRFRGDLLSVDGNDLLYRVNVVSYARRMAATACGSRRCSVTLMLSNDGFGSGATPWRAVKNAGDEAIGLTIRRGVTELIAWGPRAPAMQ